MKNQEIQTAVNIHIPSDKYKEYRKHIFDLGTFEERNWSKFVNRLIEEEFKRKGIDIEETINS